MITVPVVIVETDSGAVIAPASPLPDDRIYTVCDGVNYTVYEPGDTVPAQAQG